jgi:hypothetical protein
MDMAAAEKDEGFDRMDEFRRDMNQTSAAECTHHAQHIIVARQDRCASAPPLPGMTFITGI